MQPLIVPTAQVRMRQPPMPSRSAQVHSQCGRQPWQKQLKQWKATLYKVPGLPWNRQPPQPKRATCRGPPAAANADVFPLEVEHRLRGDSTRALQLVQGLFALNEGWFAGRAGLKDAPTAEVRARARPDAKKALAS